MSATNAIFDSSTDGDCQELQRRTKDDGGIVPTRLASKREPDQDHTHTALLSHDFDSLSTVDSEEAGGDKGVSLSRQFKDRVSEGYQKRGERCV